MQNIANNLPDAFTDYKGVTKSNVPAMNVPERVDVTHRSTQPPKRGRNLDTKDKALQKRPRGMRNPQIVNASQQNVDIQPRVEGHLKDVGHPEPNTSVHTNFGVGTSEDLDPIVEGNHEGSKGIDEISINYIDSGESYNRKTTVVDIYFASRIAEGLDLDREPKSMAECMKRSDWSKWKAAIEDELRSLIKRGVFTAVIPTPQHVFPVGAKWVFVRKRNENNEVVRYKARLVAQGFTQRPGIDYDETYSPVMSGTTFRYLISLAVKMNLSIQLMDVVTAYLYGSLDSDIYMKVPEGMKLPNPKANRNMYCVKLQKSLYGLKQSGRMWYNRLSIFLLQKGYSNNSDCHVCLLRNLRMDFALFLCMWMI